MGGIALALATMNIYNIIAHSIQQQQREIGIRMALGAGRGSVVSMVARSGLGLVGIGVLVGAPLAWMMMRMAGVGLDLFEAEIGYGLPMALAATLIAITIITTIIPTHKTNSITPITTLKK